MAMVIRNRLIALLYRLAALAGMILALVYFLRENGPLWWAFCFYGPVAGFALILLLGGEIVDNAIDLRHGVHGVAAGVYMPISLAVTSFCFEAFVIYLVVALPQNGGATVSETVFHFCLFLIPLADWVLFDEKGTVSIHVSLTWTAVPLFYLMFVFFRAQIWNGAPIRGESLYPYWFLEPSQDLIWLFAILFLGLMSAIQLLVVLLNNVMSGKYHRRLSLLN